jgi:ABC-type transport system involved in cytochrome c biogenesis ATPase subunit
LPATIKTLRVEGLFGYLDHEIDFRSEGVTILTGPNGSGKTHVLKILRALVGLDLLGLVDYPFSAATLTLSDGNRLAVKRLPDGDLTVSGSGRRRTTHGPVVLPAAQVADVRDIDTPPWIERVGADEWFDSQQGEFLTTAALARRYGSRDVLPSLVEANPWLTDFSPDVSPTFIETERLDITPERIVEPRSVAAKRRRRAPQPAIDRYVEQIRGQIAGARRRSLSVSQSADRQFAARALDKARATVRESDLRARYSSIAALHRELHANGLTEQTIDVEFPEGRTTPTERRILNVFLDDWEAKLDPLQPVHRKLQTLRGIVDLKMPDKDMHFTQEGDVVFESPGSEHLPVNQLSSGEQHMLALFTMLLFTAERGAVVLIDEPEISLHAAWKHEFLSDIEKVTSLIPVTVVMATHSSALINSRWDLVEELALQAR